MKKYLTLLIGGFIFLFMFAVPGNYVKADELKTPLGTASPLSNSLTSDSECGCNVIPITGSERNKLVAGLLSSDEFKSIKMKAKEMGYQWLGASDIEVINNLSYEVIMTGVPFSKDGQIFMFVFFDGKFAGVSPM
jgi:hypothetical protein